MEKVGKIPRNGGKIKRCRAEAGNLYFLRRALQKGKSVFRRCAVMSARHGERNRMETAPTLLSATQEMKSQGFFHQIQKEVTFCGLLHEAYA
ncbi:hypothetical protein [Stomatobaculum longum]|uniref:hypothetical protein n=1 Tax=Stomatobaculum longum TaxID=796942 RepID=UPI0028E282EF|nr:hypothetical protein [Stomatobaculum longum]